MHKNLSFLVALALMPALASAEGGWTGQGELGLVIARGNSDTDTVNGKVGLKNEDGRWVHDYHALALRSASSGDTTANRFELSAKSGRKLNERNYLYGSLRYENDDFAAYEYQATAAMGWGVYAIKNEKVELKFEMGPGYRHFQPVDQLIDRPDPEPDLLLSPGSDGELIGRGLMEYRHRLTESTEIIDTLLVESGEDNTFAQNDLGVQVKINSSLALKVGLQSRHNTDVPAERKKTDTLTTINLVFGFK